MAKKKKKKEKEHKETVEQRGLIYSDVYSLVCGDLGVGFVVANVEAVRIKFRDHRRSGRARGRETQSRPRSARPALRVARARPSRRAESGRLRDEI